MSSPDRGVDGGSWLRQAGFKALSFQSAHLEKPLVLVSCEVALPLVWTDPRWETQPVLRTSTGTRQPSLSYPGPGSPWFPRSYLGTRALSVLPSILASLEGLSAETVGSFRGPVNILDPTLFAWRVGFIALLISRCYK